MNVRTFSLGLSFTDPAVFVRSMGAAVVVFKLVAPLEGPPAAVVARISSCSICQDTVLYCLLCFLHNLSRFLELAEFVRLLCVMSVRDLSFVRSFGLIRRIFKSGGEGQIQQGAAWCVCGLTSVCGGWVCAAIWVRGLRSMYTGALPGRL